jgi:hypothetical protein
MDFDTVGGTEDRLPSIDGDKDAVGNFVVCDDVPFAVANGRVDDNIAETCVDYETTELLANIR